MTGSRPSPSTMQGPARLAFILLLALLVVLWLGGGASRADVLGQVFVRASAWAILIGTILFLPRPNWGLVAPPAVLLASAILLVALQLVPLPPALWQALPGRDVLAESVQLTGTEAPWLPISISPEATLNALGSLIVPVTVLVLMSHIGEQSFRPLTAAIVFLILAACVLGLFQFSGAAFNHPLINNAPGEVSGSFANRNHFALFVAIGCLLAPCYAMSSEHRSGLALPVSLAFVLLCVIVTLAIGSRAGLILTGIAVPLALLIVRKPLGHQLRRLRGIWRAAIIGAAALAFAAVMAAAIFLNRAVTIERISAGGTEVDLRSSIRPTLFEMIEKYFPVGTGYGTFDPAYRIDEPSELLGPRYVNLAHNDLLQVPLDGGLLGGILLLCAIGWLVWATFKAWRPGQPIRARAASGVLFLVLVASALDYPARTPMIMALVVIAAAWLNSPGGASPPRRSPERVYPT